MPKNITRRTIPTDQDEWRAWLKLEMTRKHVTWASLGRELGITTPAARKALYPEESWEAIEQALASKLDIPVHRLFPHRYTYVSGWQRLTKKERAHAH